MTRNKNKQKQKKQAFNVRLPAAVLDKLKREAMRRGMSQSDFVQLLFAQANGEIAAGGLDSRVHETAAGACIAALDLVSSRGAQSASIEKAVARLEDFLELLATGTSQ